MKFLVYIFIVLVSKVSLGQGGINDTTWFDSDWKEISKKYANFYRVISKTEKGYLVKDFYLSGDPQMIVEASSINPIVKNGKCFYFYKSNKKGSEGNYINGKKSGVWVEYYNNGKDSSVIDYLENEEKKYLRKSKYEDVFIIVEVMPEFPGGQSEMFNFIKSNVIYPKEAQKKKLTGKTFVKFIVDENGVIVDPEIAKSSGYEILDEEAKRVIMLMPKWNAGMQNNKYVKVSILIPFNFNLNN